MTTPPSDPRHLPTPEGGEPHPVPHHRDDSQRPAWRRRLAAVWSGFQLLISLAITCGVLAWLLFAPAKRSEEQSESTDKKPEQVEVAGPQLIRIQPDAPISAKLQTYKVEAAPVNVPVLRVTGTVAASRRPGGNKDDFWQFDSPELLTTYSDWDKAQADITFAETQLGRVKELAEARDTAQGEVVARLKKLVTGGTESVKDLRAEETTLLQYRIQGKKEIHEAESALRLAKRTHAALSRQLQQAGLDPDLLKSAGPDVDIVMAQVPESRLSRVRRGQSCEARFFGFPDRAFTGKVISLAPVLAKDRRTLRVLFTIDDPEDLLRPGMFAEIGLGTDSHVVLRVPADGVVHVGREDYVLTRASQSEWKVSAVQLGELIGSDLEVISGVKPGDEVLGKGAILLKPFMVRALRTDTGKPKTALAPRPEVRR